MLLHIADQGIGEQGCHLANEVRRPVNRGKADYYPCRNSSASGPHRWQGFKNLSVHFPACRFDVNSIFSTVWFCLTCRSNACLDRNTVELIHTGLSSNCTTIQ